MDREGERERGTETETQGEQEVPLYPLFQSRIRLESSCADYYIENAANWLRRIDSIGKNRRRRATDNHLGEYSMCSDSETQPPPCIPSFPRFKRREDFR